MKKLPSIRKKREFDFTQKKGTRVSSHYFNLYWMIHSPPGLGLTVSKKVSKKAVIRNRIRRICRETVRVDFQFLMENLKLVVIARPPTAELDRKAIKLNLSSALKKIRAKPR